MLVLRARKVRLALQALLVLSAVAARQAPAVRAGRVAIAERPDQSALRAPLVQLR